MSALINLGITDSNISNFEADSTDNWIINVQNYVKTNIPNRKPWIFNCRYNGTGLGTGIAWCTNELIFIDYL